MRRGTQKKKVKLAGTKKKSVFKIEELKLYYYLKK